MKHNTKSSRRHASDPAGDGMRKLMDRYNQQDKQPYSEQINMQYQLRQGGHCLVVKEQVAGQAGR
ncbi:hypothetical protein GCM10027098_02860 [Bowmanella dokdonensis]